MIVVGLGPVDPDIVAPVLGPDLHFVAKPTEVDLALAKGAIVRAAYPVNRDALDRMPQLRVIARTGVGTDLVDLALCTQRAIPVVITPGSNTRAVAEGAIGMAAALTKRFAELTRLVADGRWDERVQIPVGDLDGSTLGIVGFGRIGQRLAELAAAFGMRVLAFDAFAEVPAALRADTLEALLAESDVVSLHIPLTSENRNLFDADALGRMKPGAVLVNCARGGLIDLDAALAALESGQLGGLGLDAFDPEPPLHHPVFEHPRAILTPHVMGLSARSTEATFRDAAQGVRDVLEGRPPRALAT